MAKDHLNPALAFDQGIDLIGTPFAYGARGPQAFDCYGLVMAMARRNGQDLPDLGFASHQAQIAAMMGGSMPQWIDMAPGPGAIVLIRIGRFVSHCGYQIDQDRMIHAWAQSNGVSIVRLDDWRRRIVGFYRYAGRLA